MSNDQPSDWRNTSIRPAQRISLGNVEVPKTEETEESSSGRLNAKVELQRLEVKSDHKRSPLPSPSELNENVSEGVIPIGWPPPRLNLREDANSSSSLNKGLGDSFNDPRRPIEPWEAPLQLIEQARRGRENSAAQQTDSGAREDTRPPSELSRELMPERTPNHNFTPPPPPPGSETRQAPVIPTMGTSTLAIDSQDGPSAGSRRGQKSESKMGPIYLIGALALCGITVGGALLWPSSKPAPTPSAAVAVVSPKPEASESTSPEVQPTATPEAKPSASPAVEPSASSSPVAHRLPGQETPKALETPKADSSPKVSLSPSPLASSPTPSKTPIPVPETPKTFSLNVLIDSKAKECQVFVLGKSDPKVRIQKDAQHATSFENLPKGTYRLKVLAKGYLDYEKQFSLPADKKLAARLEKIPPAPVAQPNRPEPAPNRPAYQAPPPRYTPPAYVPPPPRYDPPPRYNPPPPRYSPPQRHELPSNM